MKNLLSQIGENLIHKIQLENIPVLDGVVLKCYHKNSPGILKFHQEVCN